MNKILFALLAFVNISYGALNVMTWDGSVSSNFNDTANWTGTVAAGSALGAGDSCVMNSGSVAATASGAVSIGALITTSGYTGALSFSGQTLTTVNSAMFDNGSTLNMGNGFTMTGNGTLHINPSGAVTASSCAVTFNGTTACVYDIDVTTTFLSFTLGTSAHCTVSGAAIAIHSSATTSLTLGNNAHLTINSGLRFYLSGATNFHSIGTGVTIDGSSTSVIFRVSGAGIITTFPAWTSTGISIGFAEQAVTGSTISFTGDFNVGSGGINLVNQGANAITYTNVSNNFTTGTFEFGSIVSGGSVTFNAGSGVYSISTHRGNLVNIGTSNDNLQTAQISCSGAWTFGSNHTVNAGTSLITFTGPGTLTSNSKRFYDLTYNNAGTGVFKNADSINCTGDIIVLNGKDSIYNPVSCVDFTASNSGDTIYLASSLNPSGVFTTSATVKWIVQGSRKINLTTCTQAVLNGNTVPVYYPTIAPISYADEPWTDTGGKTSTHAITIGGCSLGRDSIVLIGTWPAGYTINASTGLVSWDGTGSAQVAANYVVRAYANAKTDSASVTVSIGINETILTLINRWISRTINGILITP